VSPASLAWLAEEQQRFIAMLNEDLTNFNSYFSECWGGAAAVRGVVVVTATKPASLTTYINILRRHRHELAAAGGYHIAHLRPCLRQCYAALLQSRRRRRR
jgi:hypothetical protein